MTTKRIHLTGAGFTHNFGCPLSEGMWSHIFNHPDVQKDSAIRDELFNNFDFEAVYNRILYELKNIDPKSKMIIINAVKDAYDSIDRIILKKSPDWPNFAMVKKLLTSFYEKNDEKRFFFTLNQDLFVERHLSAPINGKMLIYPGPIPKISALTGDIAKRSELQDSDFITHPNKEKVNNDKNDFENKKSEDFFYLKLHGSYGWKSHHYTNALVIGQDKEDSIYREPLLGWYMDIFKKCLHENDAKLFVIGYGFRDSHINKIIADAVQSGTLKLYVLSPENPKTFIERMKSSSDKNNATVIGGLAGYFQYSLKQLFPEQTNVNEGWNLILKNFFT